MIWITRTIIPWWYFIISITFFNFEKNRATKELEIATEHHNKEMQEYRNRTNEFIKNLEAEVRIEEEIDF